MTPERPKNLAASVRQRLQNLSRQRKEDFQLLLGRYAIERLLQRLAQSQHGYRFVVKGAMQATFERRQTPLPVDIPTALTPEFHGDDSKQKQWRAFLSKSGLVAPPLAELTNRLQEFLLPPAQDLRTRGGFKLHWSSPGPWR